jgi:sulfur carrier protein
VTPAAHEIVLNGRPCELPTPGTPAAALAELGLERQARGIAVAVDGEVVPRAQWDSLALHAGARVEVLTAMQGG